MGSLDYVKYRFGAGRYIQEEHALEMTGEEIARLGKKALLISGPTAWEVCKERVTKSMAEAGIEWELSLYRGQACHEAVNRYKDTIEEKGYEVVVGIGGGRNMDMVKGVAHVANIPVVLIPTSCATCACFTPLSVMYTEEGKSIGAWYHDYEVNALIVDETVMLHQPLRLLAAGILDAMAKYVEIPNGKPEVSVEADGIDKYSAYLNAKFTYDLLFKYGMKAYEDAKNGNLTKEFHDVVYTNIALTGVISNLMRGIGQTSIAHNFGAALHTIYTDTAEEFLHGEHVATGMLMQLRWNQTPGEIPKLRAFMEEMSMPLGIEDYHLPDTKETAVEKITKFISSSQFVPKTEAGYQSIVDAIKEIS